MFILFSMKTLLLNQLFLTAKLTPVKNNTAGDRSKQITLRSIPTTDQELAVKTFSNCFLTALLEEQVLPQDLVFLCIGTPLVSGDSLGPYIGKLLQEISPQNITVYGTLDKPIHALNLTVQLDAIKKKHPDAYFIAIDASFGTRSHLGNIFINHGPLYPGMGLKKELPPVGNLSITGIVCPHGPFRSKRLELTPAKKVVRQAEIISFGIFRTLMILTILKNTPEII